MDDTDTETLQIHRCMPIDSFNQYSQIHGMVIIYDNQLTGWFMYVCMFVCICMFVYVIKRNGRTHFYILHHLEEENSCLLQITFKFATVFEIT